jgi:hypothetical protein
VEHEIAGDLEIYIKAGCPMFSGLIYVRQQYEHIKTYKNIISV